MNMKFVQGYTTILQFSIIKTVRSPDSGVLLKSVGKILRLKSENVIAAAAEA